MEGKGERREGRGERREERGERREERGERREERGERREERGERRFKWVGNIFLQFDYSIESHLLPITTNHRWGLS
jgi:hypothetical protein